MAATIHTLFGPPSTEPAVPSPTPVPGLREELRDGALAILDDLARQMLDSADDALFEMCERSTSDAERRRYLDTMRVLRLNRSPFAKEFSRQLGLGFDPADGPAPPNGTATDFDSLSIQPTEELEERIAVINLATKAESLFKQSIYELEGRLSRAQCKAANIPVKALNPSQICDAFAKAAVLLETDFQVKLVVYKLFDRVISRDLDRVYQFAFATLARHGIDGRRAAAPGQGGGRTPAPAPIATTADLLRQYGLDSLDQARTQYPEARQLSDLLAGMAQPGSGADWQATTQRLSMAHQLFDELLAEPMLAAPTRASLQPLRYPLYRSALTDPALFANPAHPTRKLLSELIELAVASENGDLSPTRFRALLDSALAAPPPATHDTAGASLELERFVQQLRDEARNRRTALLSHVRRQVAQELDLRTIGRELPQPVTTLMRSGLGPVMAMRMLNGGRASPGFRDTEVLLDRVLGSLDLVPPPTEEDLLSRARLVRDLSSAMQDIGMTDTRIAPMVLGLREVWAMLDRPKATARDGVAPSTEHDDRPQESARVVPFKPVASDAVVAARVGDPPLAEILAPIEPPEPMAATATDRAPSAPSGAVEDVTAPAVPVAPALDATVEQSVSRLPSVNATELLGRILLPESWFRVFDAAQNQTRWLKLASFHAQQGSVTFAGFDEASRLGLRAARLIDDLVSGQSEPINPTPPARDALAQLRDGRARGLL